MGILALVDLQLIQEISEKLKTSKGSFSGRLKNQDEIKAKEGSSLETLKKELDKQKKSSRKRKRDEKRKKREKSPIRFRQNQLSESGSDSETDSDSESDCFGSSDESESSTDTKENKTARISSPKGITESETEGYSE